MKHLYEDIFRVIGELGPWHLRRLGVLWLLMFLVGAHFSIPDYMERGTEEFICPNPDMPECKVNVYFHSLININGHYLFSEI